MCTGTNDIQNATKYTFIFSSPAWRGNGLYITKENLQQASIVFTVQRIVPPTWINDRDQFLQPNCELPDEFKHDCLVWMLFNGSNLTASADDLERNDRKRSIVNHFIPYTEAEVDSPDRFESDFMVQYMRDKKFSSEAQAVLNEWMKLWKAYFAHTDPHNVRDELKLNRADVGRYQIRKALQKRNESGDFAPVSFTDFETAYKILTEKLRPLVYEYGFLKS